MDIETVLRTKTIVTKTIADKSKRSESPISKPKGRNGSEYHKSGKQTNPTGKIRSEVRQGKVTPKS